MTSPRLYSYCVVQSELADVVPLVFQGVTVEQVCRDLRSLYVVKNLSTDSSVSMSCEPSLGANNEIHVAIVSHVCSESCL